MFERTPIPGLPKSRGQGSVKTIREISNLLAVVNEIKRAKQTKSMYAREFVFALDNFIKQLQVMAKDPATPSVFEKEFESFNTRFPGIVDIRNSLHHQEDRNRGLGKGGRPIV